MHHTYNNGRATDVSGENNHGLALATAPGSGSGSGPGFDSSLRFDGGASEVRIARSPSLSRLDAISARVRFLWHPKDVAFKRHNLIEGQVSFALYVTPFGGLEGTIVDRAGVWRGATAPKGTVHPDRWYEAELRHDGFSTLQVLLDGNVVAAAYDVRGPVRGVGARGISVGHWPEPDHRYTLEGFVDWVRLAKREIEPEDLLDPCCNDPKTMDELVDELGKDGFTAERAREILDEANALEAEIRSAVAAGDPARVQRVRELANEGAVAIQTGSPAALLSAATRTVAFMTERVPQGDLEAFGQRGLDLLAAAPYGDLLRRAAEGDLGVLEGMEPVLSALCLPHPPGRPGRDGRGGEPDRGGDPDTDAGPPLSEGLDHTLEPTDEPAPSDGKRRPRRPPRDMVRDGIRDKRDRRDDSDDPGKER